ncbi:MAG: phosphate signaling complex protein PhoU [Pelagibacterales bacterium]|nr:phosphate signaling complex protein PhoU [Pelagibacterales bacterium]
MTEHIVKSYEGQLQELTNIIVKMGGLAESQFSNSMIALLKRDQDLADKVIGKDFLMNEFDIKVENSVINLIALRQPMGIDLRETVSSMRISSELERIGDLSKNIAKRVRFMNFDLPSDIIASFKRASDVVQKNLKDVLDSYSRRTKDLAFRVWNSDLEVDDLVNKAMDEAMVFMKKDKKNLEISTQFLFAAKHIERIGDHVTNISENIYFLVTGDQIKGTRSKKRSTEE